MTKVKGLNLCNATCGVGRRMAKTVAPEKVSRLDREFLENGSKKLTKLFAAIFFLFLLGVGNAWGTPTVLFHETFGDNSSSARVWSDNYKVQSGVTTVYSGASYTITNFKQSKNTVGSTKSGLILSSTGTDAVFEVGPLNVSSYGSLAVSFQYKAGSTGGSYYNRDLYYKTSSSGSWSKVTVSGTKATSFNAQTASLPVAAEGISTLYLKIICQNDKGQDVIDEFELTGTAAASGYSITYHCNDATSGCPSNASGQSSLPNPLPSAPTKTGFSFGGWYTNSTLTTAAVAGATLAANADLYAKWTCNVTLNRNGATETINNVVEGTALDDIDGTGVQGGCSAWTFIGWSKTQRAAQNNTSAMTLVTNVDGVGPYYAVYRHIDSGDGTVTFTPGTDAAATSVTKGDVTCTMTTMDNASYYQIYASASGVFSISSGSITGISFTCTASGTDKYGPGNASANVGTYTYDGYNGSWTGEAASVTISTTAQIRMTTLSIDYSGSVTYYSTTATCCTTLGSIGGSVSFTNPTEAVLKWNNIAFSDSTWMVYYKTHAAGSWTSLWVDESDDPDSKTAGTDDEITVISDGGTNNKLEVIIEGLTCSTLYDFKIVAVPHTGYCDKEETLDNSGSGYNSGTWSVSSSITNGTKTSVPTTACGDYSATFAASDGYHFPAKANVSVTGASDFSWNTSTGVLSIDGEDITDDISISITCPQDACPSYAFWYGTTKEYEDNFECLSQVGTSTTWLTDLWTIPSSDQWTYIGNPSWITTYSGNLKLSDMKYALNRACALGSIGTNVMEGAQGYIRAYSDNTDAGENKYVGFIPAGYVFRWGTDGSGWNSIAFTGKTSDIEEEDWYTPLQTWTSSNADDYTYVGLKTSSGYVWSNRSETRRPIFLVPNSEWLAKDDQSKDCKFAMYYFDNTYNGWSAFMEDPDGDGIYEAWIPNDHDYTTVVFVRFPNSKGETGNWDSKYNQTSNLTLQSDKNVFTITGGSGDAYTGSWSLYDKKGTFHISANSNTNNWYCHFLPHHVLHFDANSGSGAPADQSVAINASPCEITVSTTEPTRDGYTFLGWNEDNDATTPDGDWDGGDTHAMTADVTLYAVWAANHTLTYNYNGGDGSSCSGGMKYTGESFTACSSAGSKTGYSFTGWKDGSSNDYTAGSNYTMPNSDLTLTAQWSVNSYDVTLHVNSGTINEGDVTSYTYGVGATLPTNVTRDGYRFDGWFDNSGCTGDAVTTISTTDTEDKEYWAFWTPIYTVTWHVNGDEWTDGVVTGNSRVVSGEKISDMPDAPDNDLLINCANNFMGWSTQNAGTTPKTSSYYNDLFTTVDGSPEISGNTDFYAVFAELTPSITSWSAGSYFMIDTYNNHYYALTGDVSSGVVSATDVTDAVTYDSELGTITLNPSHTSVLSTMIYTLALSEGVYSITTSTSGCIKSGSNANLTGCGGTNVWNQLDKDDADATRRFGFVCSEQTRTILYNSSNGFKNFATSNRGSSSYGTGYFYLVPTTASNYVTQCASTQVRVNYAGNGGSAPSCSSGVTTKSDSYTICSTEPTKSYYDFKGWNDGTNTYDAGDSYDLQDNTTFTAQWSATKYDITYELDGGTNHGDNPAKYTIEDEDIVLGEPTKDHCRFDGWYQTYSAGVFSNPITTISSGSHGDITIYAKWVAAYVITWDNPMGASVASTMVDEGSALGDLPVPSGSCTVGGVTYSNFVGWYTGTISGLGSAASDAGTQVTSATIPTGDVTYHAVYTNKPDYSSTHTSNVQLPTSNPTNCSLTHIKVSSSDGAPTYKAVKMGTNSSKSDNSFTVTVPIGTTSLILHGVGWKDKTANVLISGADGVTITPATKQQLAAHGNATGTIDGTSTTVFATHDTETFTISGIDAAAKQTLTITNVDERIIVWGINAAVPSGSTAKYVTKCCSSLVTLDGGSPSNGTVTFSPSGPIGTCDEDAEVTMTITPALGYQLATFSVATGDGKVATKSMSADVELNNNSSSAQAIDLTFAEDASGAYNVTATFTEKSVTGWTFTNHVTSAEITSDPIVVYVNQKVQLDIAYSPEPLLSTHKTSSQYSYTRSDGDTYVKSPSPAGDKFSFTGKASTNGNTTSITLTHNDDSDPATFAKTINVEVRALPTDKFLDLVHGVAFDDQSASITDSGGVTNGGVTFTYTAPGSDQAEWSSSYANTCEQKKVKLVGWVESEYADACIAADSFPTTDALKADSEHFFAVGATMTASNKTYYAVWAEKE